MPVKGFNSWPLTLNSTLKTNTLTKWATRDVQYSYAINYDFVPIFINLLLYLILKIIYNFLNIELNSLKKN